MFMNVVVDTTITKTRGEMLARKWISSGWPLDAKREAEYKVHSVKQSS
jgi:hypothetical protein